MSTLHSRSYQVNHWRGVKKVQYLVYVVFERPLSRFLFKVPCPYLNDPLKKYHAKSAANNAI